jgi:glycosyltransferase involved in cell wall biosynthesis
VTRVCFASHEGFAGCVTSCRSAAAVLGELWATVAPGKLLSQRILASELLVLSSWDKAYEGVLRARRGPTVLRWHSPLLQAELGREAWKVARIVELVDAREVRAIAVNDPAFRAVLRRPGVVHLPDVLDPGEYEGVSASPMAGVNVSLFGAGHWRKNLFVQSAAFDLARRRRTAENWTLHLNGQTAADRSYRVWLEATGIPHADHGYLDRAAYLSLVASMDAGLSAALSESYCYVAADHAALGVPVVTSTEVPCLDGGELVAARPGDVEDVSACLLRALDVPALAERQRASLLEHAASNARAARAALDELLDPAVDELK